MGWNVNGVFFCIVVIFGSCGESWNKWCPNVYLGLIV